MAPSLKARVRIFIIAVASVVLAAVFVPGALPVFGQMSADDAANDLVPPDSTYLQRELFLYSEQTGTSFTWQNSATTRFTLTSATPVAFLPIRGYGTIIFRIALPDSALSAISESRLLITGLEPNTSYALHRDSYENSTQFVSDSSGGYSFSQGITEPHTIWIQPAGASGQVNAAISSVSETGNIWLSSGAVKDCQGGTIGGSGPGSGFGILVNIASHVTIRNCVIENFDIAVAVLSSSDVTIEGVTIRNNGSGVVVEYGQDIRISTSTIERASGFGVIALTASGLDISESRIASSMPAFALVYSTTQSRLASSTVEDSLWGV